VSFVTQACVTVMHEYILSIKIVYNYTFSKSVNLSVHFIDKNVGSYFCKNNITDFKYCTIRVVPSTGMCHGYALIYLSRMLISNFKLTHFKID